MTGVYTSQFLPGPPRVELDDGWVTISFGAGVETNVHLRVDEAAAMAREILAQIEADAQQAAA